MALQFRMRYNDGHCAVIYRPHEPQGASKDYEFSRATMNARWAQGISDARTTLAASPWLAPMPKEVGVRVFDVIHEILVNARGRCIGSGIPQSSNTLEHRTNLPFTQPFVRTPCHNCALIAGNALDAPPRSGPTY